MLTSTQGNMLFVTIFPLLCVGLYIRIFPSDPQIVRYTKLAFVVFFILLIGNIVLGNLGDTSPSIVDITTAGQIGAICFGCLLGFYLWITEELLPRMLS